MRRIFMIAAANIRKNKGQSFSFVLITLFSSIILYLGLVTVFHYSNSFDEKAKELNTPDLFIVTQNKDDSVLANLKEKLKQDSRVEQMESNTVLLAGCTFLYANAETARKIVFMNKDNMGSIGKWSIVEEIETDGKLPIYIPYLFKTSGGYNLGNTIDLTLSSAGMQKETIEFTVAGFYEDIYFSTLNTNTTGFLLGEDEYRSIEARLGGELSGTQLLVKLKDAEGAEVFANEYYSKLKGDMPDGTILDDSHYRIIRGARTLTSSIGALIIICFSILITFISLIVVRFRIGNSIEEDIQNIGALMAIGYKNGEILLSYLLQFTELAVIGIILGILCACPLLPALSFLFAAQTGIIWRQAVSFSAVSIDFMGIGLSVLFVSYLSSRRIFKLQPITAMRFGIRTHSFKHNPCPLDRSRGGLNILFSIKQIYRDFRQNILIGLIISGVTFAAVFAGVLYYNIKVDEDKFLSMVLGEMIDARISTDTEEKAERLLSAIQNRTEVEKASYFYSDMVTAEGTSETCCYVSDSFSNMNNQDWNYKGRFPKYENEISIGGLLAKKLRKDVGDMIKISMKDSEEDYLITGLIQGSNNLGYDACMTGKGFERLSEGFFYPTVSVYLKEGEDTSAFLQNFQKDFTDVTESRNEKESTESVLGIYKQIIGILAVIIDGISILIAALVLYLVIKTVLIRKKREIAIQKAIGFTTWQLSIQNTFSVLFIIILGTASGCICAYFCLNSFISLLFSGIGLMKIILEIPASWLLGTGAAIIIIGFMISLLVSLRVRKVTPYSLLTE